jgi:hypothetical protein
MTLQMMSLCHKHEPPNIQMQRTGLYIMLLGIRNLPAADLGRWTKPLRGRFKN